MGLRLIEALVMEILKIPRKYNVSEGTVSGGVRERYIKMNAAIKQ